MGLGYGCAEIMYDIIIIGGGPAGLAAAVYAARACLHTLLIEKQPMGGGQILNTSEVDNYPGMFDISGFELGQKFSEHAEKLGIRPVTEEVKEIVCRGETKKVITDRQEYESKTLIYAAGTGYRTLGVPGEEAFTGRGGSYCATCDGAFFRGKTTAVVGGGDVALEDALFLSKICQTVYLIHRRDTFRGANILQQKVSEAENIQLILDTEVEEIGGDGIIEWIRLLCKKEGRQKTVNVDGVFIAVGSVPHSNLLNGQVSMDAYGYVIAGENCRTDTDGVYAVGDVRTKPLRQVVTAAADGANAVSDIEKLLFSK